MAGFHCVRSCQGEEPLQKFIDQGLCTQTPDSCGRIDCGRCRPVGMTLGSATPWSTECGARSLQRRRKAIQMCHGILWSGQRHRHQENQLCSCHCRGPQKRNNREVHRHWQNNTCTCHCRYQRTLPSSSAVFARMNGHEECAQNSFPWQ